MTALAKYIYARFLVEHRAVLAKCICITFMLLAMPNLSNRVLTVSAQSSLVVFVPTTSGLVACADKREWNSIRGASDDETKISFLNPRAALVITGTVAILDSSSLKPLLSIRELAVKYLRTRGPRDFMLRTKCLPAALSDAYNEFKRRRAERLTRSLDASDDVVYSIIVWWVNEKRVHVAQIQCHDREHSGSVEMSYRDVSEEFGRRFYIEGQTDFILAAIRNSDPRFAQFKMDPDIRNVWTSEQPAVLLPDLALRFARKIIRATNEFHHLVSETTPTLVSANSDCSLMNPSRGFEWLK